MTPEKETPTPKTVEEVVAEFYEEHSCYEKYDQLLEACDWLTQTLTAQNQAADERLREVVKEISYEVGQFNDGCGCCSTSGPEGDAIYWIKEIAAKHGITNL